MVWWWTVKALQLGNCSLHILHLYLCVSTFFSSTCCLVVNVPRNFFAISASGMSSSYESLGSTLSSTGEVSSLSGTSAGSAFIGGSLTVEATLLLFCELILFGGRPDLLGFCSSWLGFGFNWGWCISCIQSFTIFDTSAYPAGPSASLM